jgi:hypothetical protein
MPKKTFILGVGAQKTGTTWLHRLLSGQAYSDFGFTKEYQVLHAIYNADTKIRRRHIINEALLLMDDNYDKWRGAPKVKQLSFLANPPSYYSYFAERVKPLDKCLTGDISPIYSSLSKEALKSIKAGFDEYGIQVLPVFIMRDPVYRLQSYIRMRFHAKGITPSYDQEITEMHSYIGSPEDEKRSNYMRTLRNLEEVFWNDASLFFYENFFRPETITHLEEKIGVKIEGVNFSKHVGKSQSKNLLKRDDYDLFRFAYDDIYEFVESEVSEPAPWHFRS